MKRYLLILAALMLLLTAPAQAGDRFPDFPLSGFVSPEQQAYLGIDGEGATPSSIKADYLLVELFSMYCPICQREAPAVNGLYEKIVSGKLGERIKVIGIGAGNTPFEIDFFRKKFAVDFPLFTDEGFTYHKALGEVGTPSFYLVDVATMDILWFQEGEIKDMDATLNLLAEKTAR